MADGTQSTEVATVETSPRANGLAGIRVVQDVVPVLDTARFEQMQRIANVMATSSLVPETLTKDLRPDQILANCFLVVNQAVRWGMDPFAVAQCVSVIHGRLCYEGKLVAAVLETKIGVQLNYKWNDQTGDRMGITVTGTLPDGRTESVFGTVADWKTTGKGSPWIPSQFAKMLAYRGAREWARLHAPAVMLGVYTPDEMGDLAIRRMVDITPNAGAVAPPKGPPPAPKKAPPSPPKPAEAELFPDPIAYLTHLEEEMVVAGDAKLLGEVWDAHMASSDGRLSREHQEKAKDLFERYSWKIAKSPGQTEMAMGG